MAASAAAFAAAEAIAAVGIAAAALVAASAAAAVAAALLSAASSGLRRILPSSSSCSSSSSSDTNSSDSYSGNSSSDSSSSSSSSSINPDSSSSSSSTSSNSDRSSSSRRGGLGVVAHSDGDVVLHAAADAIFAAAGAPDIGEQFPDTAAANKGRDSREFAAAAAAAAAAAGYSVAQLDVTLLLQRPHISSKKQQMAASLAAAFNLDRSQVSLKAKTAEGLGPVGRSQAVECHAVALLQRKNAAHTPQ
ncbi:hypothetical protein ACSSS7_007789 [Eimeria intestinalis]